jgi:hypothetical protein
MFNAQYFLIVFIEVLTLLIGFFLGKFLFSRSSYVESKVEKLNSWNSHEDFFGSNYSNNKPETMYFNIHDRLNLYDLEIRVLKRLIDSNQMSVVEFNELIKLANLSKENQRQRRHLFIKDLNLKLSILNGCRENILRLDGEIDKRSKIYSLNDSLDKNLLEMHLKSLC